MATVPRRGCPEGRLKGIAKTRAMKERGKRRKAYRRMRKQEPGCWDSDPVEKRFRLRLGHLWGCLGFFSHHGKR